MKYFKNCTCIEDVKEQYKQLTKKYHPDLNRETDTTEIMKEINAEFTKLHKQYKNIHRTESGETFESQKQTEETPEEFIEILNKIAHLEGLDIEICGSWIWVSGNTFNHKDSLKEAGFRWASKKKMWYWHSADADCKGNGKSTIEDIRTKYGSQKIENKPMNKLTA